MSASTVVYINGEPGFVGGPKSVVSHSASRATLRRNSIKKRLSIVKGGAKANESRTALTDAHNSAPQMQIYEGVSLCCSTLDDVLGVVGNTVVSRASGSVLLSCGGRVALLSSLVSLVVAVSPQESLLYTFTCCAGAPPPASISFAHPVSLVSAGESHCALVTEERLLYTWGSNSDGQLGLPSVHGSSEEPQLVMSDVLQVSCGGVHTLCVSVHHQLSAWGSNMSSQLGSQLKSARIYRSAQDLPQSLPVLCASAGLMHSVLVLQGGSCLSWGDNSRAQLVPPSFTVPVSLCVCATYSSFLLTEGGALHSFPPLDTPSLEGRVVTGVSAGLSHQCFSSCGALDALLSCPWDASSLYSCARLVPHSLLSRFWSGIQRRRSSGSLQLDVLYTEHNRTFVHVVNTSETESQRVQLGIPADLLHQDNRVVVDPPRPFLLMPGQRKRLMVYCRHLSYTSLVHVNQGLLFMMLSGPAYLPLCPLVPCLPEDNVLLYMIGKTIGPAAYHALCSSGVTPLLLSGRMLVGSVPLRHARHAVSRVNAYTRACAAVFRCCAVSVPSLRIRHTSGDSGGLLVMSPHVSMASLATKRSVACPSLDLDALGSEPGPPVAMEAFPKLWRSTKCILMCRVEQQSSLSLPQWISVLSYATATCNGVIFHIDYPNFYCCFDTNIEACRASVYLSSEHPEQLSIVCCYGRVVIGFWQDTLNVYGHPINKCKRWMREGRCSVGGVSVDRHCKRALVGTFDVSIDSHGILNSGGSSEMHPTAVHVRYLSYGGQGTTVLQRNGHSSLVSIQSASRQYHLTVLHGQCTAWSMELSCGFTSLAPLVGRLLDAQRLPTESALVGQGPSDTPEYAEAFCALLREACSREPLVMLVSDLQWADAATLRVLRAASDSVSPLLLACSHWGPADPPGSWPVIVREPEAHLPSVSSLPHAQLKALQCVCIAGGPLPADGLSSLNARLSELCSLGLLWRPSDSTVSLVDPGISEEALRPLSESQLEWLRCRVGTLLRGAVDSEDSEEEPADPRRLQYILRGSGLSQDTLFADSSSDDSYGSLDGHSSTDFSSGDFEDEDRSYFGVVMLDEKARAPTKNSPVPSLSLSTALPAASSAPVRKKKRRVKKKKRGRRKSARKSAKKSDRVQKSGNSAKSPKE